MRLAKSGAAGDAARAPAIVLIGFQSMGNLGLGYLAATLRQSGYDVRVLDIELPEHALVEAVREARPLLVGFSLIFQFYIRRYASLMEALRRSIAEDKKPPPAPRKAAATTLARKQA